jgi:hypothetical protein
MQALGILLVFGVFASLCGWVVVLHRRLHQARQDAADLTARLRSEHEALSCLGRHVAAAQRTREPIALDLHCEATLDRLIAEWTLASRIRREWDRKERAIRLRPTAGEISTPDTRTLR